MQATITAAERMRFEYSIRAWPVFAGRTRPLHRGQSGQPRPEAVRRTYAPLGMMISRPISATMLMRTNSAGVTRSPSRRGITRERSRAVRAAILEPATRLC
jgi:hypothetical protein